MNNWFKTGIRRPSVNCPNCIAVLARILCLLLFSSFQIAAQKEAASFDWSSYTAWQNTTRYTKTYVVDQKHPLASDDNPGTADRPLLTINKAAQLVEAGERVLIHAGVYREKIRPKNDGEGPDQMISYESVPGAKVIIKGSRVLPVAWIQRRVYTDELPDSTLTLTWSRKLWMATIPDTIFEEGYYPLRLPNILPEEYELMPWAHPVKDLAPYNSTRALLFQNGRRMSQLEDYGDLTRLPGSFWIDVDGKTVHIHPFGSGNPNNELFEIGVQNHLLKPQKIGMGYIQVRGLTFEHCANGFLRTSTGAVTILGGHHWIFEDNVIRQNNSSGLEVGYYAFEFEDPNPENIQPRTDEDLGGMLVRNNRIHDCGTAGIRSYTVTNGIIENNTIWNCGWQDAENYWECSGIKLLRTRKTLVKGNHIYNIQGGNGIWLDWDNQYSRITANVIHDIQNIQGGIFVEASQVPNLVDNNFIWNIDGHGIYANDSDELMVYHNLIAHTTGPVVNAVVATERKLNGRWLTATRNKVLNNIFINGGGAINFSSEDNAADYNLYVSTREPVHIDLEEWKKSGFGRNSKSMRAFVRFVPEVMYFRWSSPEEVPLVPALEELKFDFFQTTRKDGKGVPGPFSRLDRDCALLLNENLK
jgi:alpha-N-arabinofuranosidase